MKKGLTGLIAMIFLAACVGGCAVGTESKSSPAEMKSTVEGTAAGAAATEKGPAPKVGTDMLMGC